MTQLKTSESAPVIHLPGIWTDRNAGARERLKQNKGRILAVLKTIRATHVVVTYNGSGDSGCVDSVDIYRDKKEMKIKRRVTILETSSRWNKKKEKWDDRTNKRTLLLNDALEQYVYDWSALEHPGWENNDGGSGELDNVRKAASLRMNVSPAQAGSVSVK